MEVFSKFKVLFISTVYTFLYVAADLMSFGKHFCEYPGASVNVTSHQMLHGISWSHCGVLCLINDQCWAIRVQKDSDVCDLLYGEITAFNVATTMSFWAKHDDCNAESVCCNAEF